MVLCSVSLPWVIVSQLRTHQPLRVRRDSESMVHTTPTRIPVLNRLSGPASSQRASKAKMAKSLPHSTLGPNALGPIGRHDRGPVRGYLRWWRRRRRRLLRPKSDNSGTSMRAEEERLLRKATQAHIINGGPDGSVLEPRWTNALRLCVKLGFNCTRSPSVFATMEVRKIGLMRTLKVSNSA